MLDSFVHSNIVLHVLPSHWWSWLLVIQLKTKFQTASTVCANTHTNSYCLGVNCFLLRLLGLSGYKWKESKVCPVVRDCAGHLAKTETGWAQPGELSRWHWEYGVSSKNKATAHRCVDLGWVLQPWKRWLQLAHRCNESPAAQRLFCEVFSHFFGPFQIWEFEVWYLPSTVECIALLAKVYTANCSLS